MGEVHAAAGPDSQRAGSEEGVRGGNGSLGLPLDALADVQRRLGNRSTVALVAAAQASRVQREVSTGYPAAALAVQQADAARFLREPPRTATAILDFVDMARRLAASQPPQPVRAVGMLDGVEQRLLQITAHDHLERSGVPSNSTMADEARTALSAVQQLARIVRRNTDYTHPLTAGFLRAWDRDVRPVHEAASTLRVLTGEGTREDQARAAREHSNAEARGWFFAAVLAPVVIEAAVGLAVTGTAAAGTTAASAGTATTAASLAARAYVWVGANQALALTGAEIGLGTTIQVYEHGPSALLARVATPEGLAQTAVDIVFLRAAGGGGGGRRGMRPGGPSGEPPAEPPPPGPTRGSPLRLSVTSASGSRATGVVQGPAPASSPLRQSPAAAEGAAGPGTVAGGPSSAPTARPGASHITSLTTHSARQREDMEIEVPPPSSHAHGRWVARFQALVSRHSNASIQTTNAGRRVQGDQAMGLPVDCEVVPDDAPGPLDPNQRRLSDVVRWYRALRAMRLTPQGRDAIGAIGLHDEPVGFAPTGHEFNPATRRTNVDPTQARTPAAMASMTVHEGTHGTQEHQVRVGARTQISALRHDRREYLRLRFVEEAEAESNAVEHQLARSPNGTITSPAWWVQEYLDARNGTIARLRGRVSEQEAVAAGVASGRTRLALVWGRIRTSGPGHPTYEQHYGRQYARELGIPTRPAPATPGIVPTPGR